jgi:cytochrome bd-type quinol oxidase subunit 2
MSKRELFQVLCGLVSIVGPVVFGVLWIAEKSSGNRAQPKEQDDGFHLRLSIGVGILVIAILLEVYAL